MWFFVLSSVKFAHRMCVRYYNHWTKLSCENDESIVRKCAFPNSCRSGEPVTSDVKPRGSEQLEWASVPSSDSRGCIGDGAAAYRTQVHGTVQWLSRCETISNDVKGRGRIDLLERTWSSFLYRLVVLEEALEPLGWLRCDRLTLNQQREGFAILASWRSWVQEEGGPNSVVGGNARKSARFAEV